MSDPYFPSLKDIMTAEHTLNDILVPTPLMKNRNLSDKYEANIFLKREDLQMVRSYKIRGAYNKIKSLTPEEMEKGVVCASAGNHAQGVAFSCSKLGIQGKIYMPVTTPRQKINQVKMFGGKSIEVVLTGDTFDQANTAAIEACKKNDMVFIPPFNDPRIIEGQATVGLEIIQEARMKLDYIFVPIGGGGLASGIGSFYKQMSPKTKIIGVEPAGAAGMKKSFECGEVTELNEVDKFVDGAAVQRVGELTYAICKKVLDDIVVVPEGKICTTILDLYNFDAIVVEPAGALSMSALDFYKNEIKGKNVVCVVSGSNNDITRMEDIKERSLLYEGLKRRPFSAKSRRTPEFCQQRPGPPRRHHLFRIQEEDKPRKRSCPHRHRDPASRRFPGPAGPHEIRRYPLRISQRQSEPIRIPDRIICRRVRGPKSLFETDLIGEFFPNPISIHEKPVSFPCFKKK